MYKRPFALLFLLTCAAASRLPAGTIITTNLPSNVEIVNINAREDGAAVYNGGNTGQAFWYQPFGSGANGLLSIPVTPGTYTFNIVDPLEASRQFPSLNTAQLGTIFTAWTYNNPWITQFFVFDLSAATNPNEPQLFDGADDPDSYGNAQDAYNAAVARGETNKIQIDPVHGREGTNYTTTYTVTQATSLVFVIPDYALSDNTGGVSVVVTQVPEPRTTGWCAAAGGLLTAGWLRRRRLATV